ncbi:MAG TPA: PQQ-binding-like beta-propeller repeat protein [Gemmataceae bacterium]|nr:PQQ-binding-like beta-propeller repeat protein [Gemmataceae bacterium]
MPTLLLRFGIGIVACVVCFALPARNFADDWPMWGRDWSHYAVSPEKGAPVDFAFDVVSEGKLVSRAKNIAWSTRIGDRPYGTPVIADGMIWVGTSQPYGTAKNDDNTVLMCFREHDGKLLYQHASPRNGKAQGPEKPAKDIIEALGRVFLPQPEIDVRMRCSPLVEGNRLWHINYRSEVEYLDLRPLKRGTGDPKVLWSVDMRKEFGVGPALPWCPALAGLAPSVVGYKDWLYISTANGDESATGLASDAPSLLCLEKATGKLVWKDNLPGKNIIQFQMSTPLVMEVKGRAQVIFGQGDGWIRSFDAKTGALIWKCDLNRKDAKFSYGRSNNERNYIVATPVAYDGRVYVATGQDTGKEGYGCLFCIDPTREGDVSRELEAEPGKGKRNANSAVVWSTREAKAPSEPKSLAGREYLFGNTICTCVIHEGLVYAAETGGWLHCFDARTGEHLWVHDARAGIQKSPLCVDGKVYVADEDGEILIFACGLQKKLLGTVDVGQEIRANPIFANGTLYLASDRDLFAIREKK